VNTSSTLLIQGEVSKYFNLQGSFGVILNRPMYAYQGYLYGMYLDNLGNTRAFKIPTEKLDSVDLV